MGRFKLEAAQLYVEACNTSRLWLDRLECRAVQWIAILNTAQHSFNSLYTPANPPNWSLLTQCGCGLQCGTFLGWQDNISSVLSNCSNHSIPSQYFQQKMCQHLLSDSLLLQSNWEGGYIQIGGFYFMSVQQLRSTTGLSMYSWLRCHWDKRLERI